MSQTNPKVTFMPDNRSASVRLNTTLLDAARRANVHIRTRCSGQAACLMCKVHAGDQSGLSEPGKNERLKLGSQLQEGLRLSCQARITGDVTVTVPEDPLKAAVRARLAKQREEDDWP
ncbi:hypothetical protein YDYSY3_28330 [Paenibacillus chitinolyticus]|uniref:2Fe-2S iron-sulfur cluster-binding protein n=1 Tax=Paenibacillus chitinolyticus TaxID=79263 RepID=UPI0026E4FA92|nr:2Fe-2S iron-sulfur cluster-binding protein [Paenibacillus chitinolyticus]GKS11833.1 hypothetical protein YDYSY3_28330 [Paenibacillus chitinolyticus]